jgi:pyrroline-5-carboxylate reductase
MTALGSTLAMFSLARLSRLAPYKHANPRVSTRRDARPLRVVVNFRAATARAAAADIQPRIGFIGAGSMAEAMARGFVQGGVASASNISVSPSTKPDRNASWSEDVGATVVGSNLEVMESSDVVFLSVKPHILPVVLEEIAEAVDSSRHLLVSVAAGVPVEFIEKTLRKATEKKNKKDMKEMRVTVIDHGDAMDDMDEDSDSDDEDDDMDDGMRLKMKEEKKKRKQLKKLKSLLEDGVITRDEFEAKSASVGPPDPTIMPVETEEERRLRKEQKKMMKMREKEEKKARKMREKEEKELAKEAEKEEKRKSAPRVVRVMPNTPCMVGAAASAACVGDEPADPMLAASDLDSVVRLMRGCGECVVVPERLMDAVVGVSGSGPAYVFQFIEALADGGVAAGLPRVDANLLAAQTVMGASKMVLETGSHPGELKDKVCSPGGTTIRAVHELEKGGLRATVMSAVMASAARSAELGKMSGGKDEDKKRKKK